MKITNKQLLFTFVICLFIPIFVYGQYQVVPGFQETKISKGKFKLSSASRIVADSNSYKKLKQDMTVFSKELGELTGIKLSVTQGISQIGDLFFTLKESDETLGKEGYQMDIAGQVLVKANTSIGIFYGMQSLLQLFEQDNKIQKASIAQESS